MWIFFYIRNFQGDTCYNNSSFYLIFWGQREYEILTMRVRAYFEIFWVTITRQQLRLKSGESSSSKSSDARQNLRCGHVTCERWRHLAVRRHDIHEGKCRAIFCEVLVDGCYVRTCNKPKDTVILSLQEVLENGTLSEIIVLSNFSPKLTRSGWDFQSNVARKWRKRKKQTKPVLQT